MNPDAPHAAQPAESGSATAAQRLDSQLHALTARLSGGLSPISLALAYLDWALHLASQPAQGSELAAQALDAWVQACAQLGSHDAPPAEDARFAAPAWQPWPWNALALTHQAAERWWDQATALRGVSPHHREMVRFGARQWLDMLAPSNLPWLNPEVLQRTRETLGANLAGGAAQALDAWRQRQGLPPLNPPPQQYRPGIEVALTPGKVVHRNRLIELIQYEATTPRVQAEPILIVPSWIMKYYILDLSPHNSMVRWLVEQGHTVFILSWHNPDESDALLGMEDYLELGVFDALAAIKRLLPGQAVHACGYCLGGTLLAIAAAALARPARVAQAAALPPLASLSLLASETDFSEPGEMGVLIDESQVSLLEDMMAERGFLTGRQMAGSFSFLHSRELVWAQLLRELWLDEPNPPNDLMAWNADTTRMPAQMHSEYLRRCYLHNDLALARYPVEGQPVALSDITLPMFVVGTEKDHVSPWRSVYKIHQLCDSEICFVLTSGGHNAGIVSEPGHAHRHYALRTRPAHGAWVAPEAWSEGAERREGSWWSAWDDWLRAQGSGRQVAARKPSATATLGAAPGDYVHQCYLD